MPYKKLSEYQCKKLYYKDTDYFIDYINKDRVSHMCNDKKLVIKVDNGTKHRFSRGLVKIGVSLNECVEWITSRDTDENYVIEHPLKFSDEVYVAIRAGSYFDEVIINKNGGVNLVNPEENATLIKVNIDDDAEKIIFDNDNKLNGFIRDLYKFYSKYHFVFMEVNPVVLVDDKYVPLDFAVLYDEDSLYLFDGDDKKILNMQYFQEDKVSFEEEEIKKLDKRTGGSLKFTLLNPNGNIWTLIAGGGASVVYTDAIVNRGYLNELANYGEYSGAPQEELVEEYCNRVFNLMNKVESNKTLFIGGGIANFTDVASTFKGIINSIHNNVNAFKNTTVWIRRGGPNYKKGLNDLKVVLDKYEIKNYVNGPDVPITSIVTSALEKRDHDKPNVNLNIIPNIDINYYFDNVISYDFNNTKCVIYGYNKKAIQRMLDFDYTCGKNKPSIVTVVNPIQLKDTTEPFFWGNKAILMDVCIDFEYCASKYDFDTVVSFISYRSTFSIVNEVLRSEKVKKIIVIAEGVPERLTRIMNKSARDKGVLLLGPATVGGIKAGELRLGNTGGSIENIIECKLHKKGSVAFVTRSGGLLNELCKIVSNKTDGVYQGMSIGGDRWPGSTFIDHVLSYEKDENVSMIIILGEVGGIQELIVSQAVKQGLITKPIIGWCMGTTADYISENIQFGHAGSSATQDFESATYKNSYMSNNGILVPDSFESLSELIEDTFKLLNKEPVYNNTEPLIINPNRVLPTFYSSISNEIGDELMYNGVKISELLTGGIGKTIGHLWLKKDLPEWFAKYIELILIVTADHGAMVSGAHNTIVASRAGKDMISSLCSGLLTIGDYFGGALNESAKQFKYGFDNLTPLEFVEYVKSNKQVIMGIGHKIKTIDNPDKRVEILKKYVMANFPKYDHVSYALQVEQITIQKRNNLILNVDGFIANSLLDAFSSVLLKEEIDNIIENDFINAFFVLGRTIGFIGHWYDQKRLKQTLFRLNNNDVQYLD